jgi:nitrogen regulatory protein PII-like uncharacterized protein
MVGITGFFLKSLSPLAPARPHAYNVREGGRVRAG